MAVSLESLSKPGHRPVQITIVGEGGVGKTSLAAAFPNPVFIRTEDGMESLGANAPMAFPIANNSQDVLDQINALGEGDHPYQTLVVDSITKLNILIEQEIVASDPRAQSINQALGGYGAGLSAVAERHRQIKFMTDQLNRFKAMNIVFIAHADSEVIDLPDQDQYTRYTIRMHKKSVAHYSDDVDVVGFIKLKTFTRSGANEDKMKAFTDGSRIITCYPTPNHISKNRYGISEDLLYVPGTNPLAEFIPILQQPQTTTEAA